MNAVVGSGILEGSSSATSEAVLSRIADTAIDLQSIRFSSAAAAIKCVALHLGSGRHVAFEPSVATQNSWEFGQLLPLSGSHMQVLSEFAIPSHKTNLLMVSAESAEKYLKQISNSEGYDDIDVVIAGALDGHESRGLILKGAKLVVSGELICAIDPTLSAAIYNSARIYGYSIGLQFGPDSNLIESDNHCRAQVLLKHLAEKGELDPSEFEVVYDSLHCFDSAKLDMVAEVGRQLGFNIR